MMIKIKRLQLSHIGCINMILQNKVQGSVTNTERDELGSELNAKAALEDVGHNADLYIAIQEDNTQN